VPEAVHLSGFRRCQDVLAGHPGEFFFRFRSPLESYKSVFREERGSEDRPKAGGGKEKVCL
jgi:hypothetical protein